MENSVLIVDDNEIMQSFLHYLLEPAFNVQTSRNAEEALFFLNESAPLPDLILADFDLEGMNGLDLLIKIKSTKRYKQIPVVILSGKKTYKDACLNAGAAFYVVKPFVPAELQKILAELAKPEHLKQTG